MGSPLDLPPDIIINIFCRLAVHSVLECKRVCRTWRSIIFDINFAHMHLKSSINYSKKNSFLLFPDQVSDDVKTCNGLCIREFDDENNNYGPYNWIYHSPIDSDSFIIGSCNGLICLSSSQDLLMRQNYSVRVCNPVTREYITLPCLYPGNQRFQIGSGFGFINSPPCGGGKQKEYKVVRIYYHLDNRSVGLVHVYTVGDGRGWRYKGEVSSSIFYINKKNLGVFANGSLYWLLDGGVKVGCFDLAQEEFRFIMLPTCFYDRCGYEYHNKPFFLGGLLCFVDRQSSLDDFQPIYIRIWSLKKNDEWEIIFHLEYANERTFEPLAITERGELLFSTRDRNLCCYNPKTGIFKIYDHLFILVQVIPHIESFVSLKALGEYDVKIVESENISMKYGEEGWRSPKKRRYFGPNGYIK